MDDIAMTDTDTFPVPVNEAPSLPATTPTLTLTLPLRPQPTINANKQAAMLLKQQMKKKKQQQRAQDLAKVKSWVSQRTEEKAATMLEGLGLAEDKEREDGEARDADVVEDILLRSQSWNEFFNLPHPSHEPSADMDALSSKVLKQSPAMKTQLRELKATAERRGLTLDEYLTLKENNSSFKMVQVAEMKEGGGGGSGGDGGGGMGEERVGSLKTETKVEKDVGEDSWELAPEERHTVPRFGEIDFGAGMGGL